MDTKAIVSLVLCLNTENRKPINKQDSAIEEYKAIILINGGVQKVESQTIEAYFFEQLHSNRTIDAFIEDTNPDREKKSRYSEKGKAFTFNSNDTEVAYCSLILGIFKIKESNFLIYVDNVYQQPALPPKGYSIYQIASIQFISFQERRDKEEEGILETLKQEIFNFGFYFSFDRDFTLKSETYYCQSFVKPTNKFFWNENLLENLLQAKNYEEWRIPVIQGYYGKFEAFVGSTKISYYLICRRSKDRSGTRFYSRGIDESGNCSNFIETEQCIMVGKYLMSAVFLSGSSPIFWEQKSQTKPIRLTRNKELTKGPFVEHLVNLNALYENIFVFNLLEKKKEGENLLIQAFEQMISENESHINGFCRYAYFDINDCLKKKNYGLIVGMVNKVDRIIQHFNCFIYDTGELTIMAKQTGVFRISCLDCLNRTNIFMKALAIKTLEVQLEYVGISISSLVEDLIQKSDEQLDSLVKQFKNLWLGKADYESLIYAGTRAASGLKNKFLDDLDSSFVSLQRLYNEKFMDRIKQTSIDLLHNGKKGRMKLENVHRKYTSPLKVHILSWNVNATNPDKLNVKEVVKSFEGADLIAFGVQEMMELHANNIVLEEEETKISGAWQKCLMEHLSNELSGKYIFVQKIEMVGICLIIFISESWKNTLRSVHKDTVKTGMGGTFGNKGGAVIRVNIFDTSLCFTCAHLAAGESKTKERIDDVEQIHKKAFQQNKSGIQNEYDIEASDHKFFFGDLNFRLMGEFKDFTSLFEFPNKDNSSEYMEKEKKLVDEYVNRDQLTELKMRSEANSYLASYSEEKITFLPTYKLEKQTGRYTVEKNRNPSWCDRILFWSDDLENHSCECSMYTSLNVKGSDHRPVLGKFVVSILKQETKVADKNSHSTGKNFRDTFFESGDLLH